MTGIEQIEWATKDGRVMRLGEMGTSHLLNAARMLERAARAEQSAYWQVGCVLSSEFAEEAWAQAGKELDRNLDQWRALAKAMRDVAASRDVGRSPRMGGTVVRRDASE